VPVATVEPLPVAADARGVLVEPLPPSAFADQRNAHLVVTAPGAVRGNHVHRRGTEVVVVLGPALVRLREDGAPRDVEVPAGAAYRVTLPPGVAHAFRGAGPGPMVIVSFNSASYDPAAPDTYAARLLEPVTVGPA
jgi:UDP-2-acetamido-2,6-beta-L-arabino-hexul-4-ose reductase